ncbi:MAG: thioredoxin domain-containing protein [Candidatus Levybacteria bacterium]|nr:thioredoxin domain-containing protein [Candidatus Levybacteria bacterium]
MDSESKKSITIPIPSLPKKISTIQVLVAFLIIASFLIGVLITKVRYLESGSPSKAGAAAQIPPSDLGQPQAQPPAKTANIEDVNIEGRPFIGKENSPATLAYWLDFQCPFCQRFETDTLPTLIEKYVDTGKLRIVFKNYQFLGEDSTTAGLAAQAVWELYPDKYISWHNAMFAKQDEENGGFGNKESVIELTKTISGIDAGKVSSLMDQKKDEYQKILDDDRSEGDSFGVSGTPGFIIGNQLISGAQATSSFTQAIDDILNK